MENNIDHITDKRLLIDLVGYDPDYVQPKSFKELKSGMKCQILPMNESKGWQIGILRFNKGYDNGDPTSIYNLKSFWYVNIKFPDYYGPIPILLKDLNHIKIHKNG